MSSRYKILMIALVLTSLSTRLSAGSGLTCSDPIELTQGYESTISGPCTRYYVANTFDLPLAISFYPYSTTAPAPKLYLDFSCTSGVYEDSILCNLFCTSHSAYISMPYEQIPSLTYDDQGNPCYRVAFGEFYRDMLLQQGIDYNVPVYVTVVYGGGGRLMMEPDAFNNCMDGAKFMHLGDTVQVAAFDDERHVIVPYVQWQYDSIRYVWQGTQPCTLAVGNKCDFDPTSADPCIVDAGVIQPGGAFKVSSELLMEYVDNQVLYPNEAGMYFAKFYSEAPGIMKIEKIPAPAPSGEAELLRYGVATDVYRDDTSHVYAIPSSWVKSMMFTTPTPFIFRMYVGTTPDFYTTEAIATYQFDSSEDGHELYLFAPDMAALWRKKAAGENYLYIRFECGVSTTVTPALWNPSACMEHTTRIEAGKQFEVASKSNDIYRLYYDEWKGGDMTISWTSGQAACAFFLSDTCVVPNSVAPPVFYTGTIPKRGSTVCTSDTIDSWAQYVDPDGYLYMRFYSNAKAKITVTTAAPPEEDPECNTYDSVMTVPAWDPYVWRGKTYTKSGTYISEGTADPATGCVDTVFRLQITFHPTEYADSTMSACDTILFNGKPYTQSGEYNDTTIAADDTRIITRLHLTVMHSSYTTVVIKQKDDPYQSPQGVVYTKTGKYIEVLPNAIGCDSVITYDVTIYTTEYQTIVETGCDSIVTNHKTYTATGVYQDTVQMLEGNTIIRTLDFTIHHTTYAEWSKNVCEEYTLHTGQRVTESGDYLDTLPNRNGCDSVVTLHLVILEDCYRTVYFCQGMNWEHTEEQDGLVLTYRHYEYEEPDPDWYMEGVILTREEERTLVDFAKAEENLYKHYSDGFVPIKSITWTYQPLGEMAYGPIETDKEPKWVASGSVSMTVRFLCGQVHHTKFTTDVDMVGAEAMSGQKVMRNGQMIIIRGGAKYTVLGARIE